MHFGPINYTDTKAAPPSAYRCSTCGAHGCKLWREYQTFLNHQTLACCDCAGKEQQEDVSGIDARGSFTDEDGVTSVQIGWRVPAVPTEDGTTFWGYCAIPKAGCEWWYRLPTRPFAAEIVS